jgi:hypothetical protein
MDDSDSNFLLNIISDKKTISSEGTSMAARSGIGLADALVTADYIMQAEQNGREHKAVRFIFLAAGADDVYGMRNIDAKLLAGSLLISLDSAGTGKAALRSKYAAILQSNLPLTPAKTATKYAYVISVSGYPGDKFGTTADAPNPMSAIIKILADVNSSGVIYDLCSIDGGTDALTSPTEATAVIAVNDYEQNRALQIFESSSKAIGDKYGTIDITQTVVPEYSVTSEDSSKIATQLFSITGGDFTEDNKGIMGVFVGRVLLTPNRFICDVSIIGSDAETVEKVAKECAEIEVLSEIPLKRISTFPYFSTPKDDAAVIDFLDKYKAVTGSSIGTKASLGISHLGFMTSKVPGLPIISIGVSVENEGTPDEQVLLGDIAEPANALLDYACADAQ